MPTQKLASNAALAPTNRNKRTMAQVCKNSACALLPTALQVELEFRASMNNQTNAAKWSILWQERPLKPYALTWLPQDSCDWSKAPTPSLTIGMAFSDTTKHMGHLDASLNAYEEHCNPLFIETCPHSGAIAYWCEGLTKAIICWQHVIEPPPDNNDVWSAMGPCLWDNWLKTYMACQQALYFLPNPRTQYATPCIDQFCAKDYSFRQSNSGTSILFLREHKPLQCHHWHPPPVLPHQCLAWNYGNDHCPLLP